MNMELPAAALLLVAMPGAPSSFLLLVAMPFATSSFLLLVRLLNEFARCF